MSGYVGVRVVFGVAVVADTVEARNFIRTLMINKNLPQKFFDMFDQYYDYHVLQRGDDPDEYNEHDPKHCSIPEDYWAYFDTVLHEPLHGEPLIISCFRQACCLSKEWKKQIVIGVEVTFVEEVWLSPSGVDHSALSLSEEVMNNVKSQLSDNGFSTDTKMYFILNDCIKCT